MNRPGITPALLRELFSYDPETGLLTWRLRPRGLFGSDREWLRWNGRYAGTEAFRVKPSGYREGMIFRRQHKAHRVVWAIVHGAWPDGDIDHINQNRSDNRLSNLRAVDRSTNCRNSGHRRNNTSGVLGVAPSGRRWRAYIRTGGINRHLGSFDTVEAAGAARKAAEVRHGYHPNHGARCGVEWSDQ